MSARAKRELAATNDLMQKCDLLVSDMMLAMKYKKRRDGSAIGVGGIKELVSKTAGSLSEMLEAAKALRALLPKKDESS